MLLSPSLALTAMGKEGRKMSMEAHYELEVPLLLVHYTHPSIGGSGFFFLALALETELEADDSASPGLLGRGDPIKGNAKEGEVTLYNSTNASDFKPFVKELCTALLAMSRLSLTPKPYRGTAQLNSQQAAIIA